MSDKTTIQCAPDGPLLVRNLRTLRSADGSQTWPTQKPVALCRCGASGNKPFCDGKHREVGFSDADQRPEEGHSANPGGGPSEISIEVDGPYVVCGDAELIGYEANEKELYLCRCGASQDKPFCDGSHGSAGFRG